MSPCEFSDQCGYVEWLKDNEQSPVCQKDPKKCGRLVPNELGISVEKYGPQTHEELETAAEILGFKKSD
ncbi:hypothetical protein LDC_1969 [sediment metagenome]|uniref:Uncharacterized protein n=1 Tax=sediment metagenome TaxID=749907 RepID=D9PKA3_9ZZZZ